jgi:uncharacterized membrane protein
MIAALLRDRRGSTAIFAALSMSTMLGFVALGVDAAHWLHLRQRAQAVADAAATAAVLESGDAPGEALAMAAAHGLIDGSDGVTVTAGWRKAHGSAVIDVDIHQRATMHFAQLFLRTPVSIAVHASATADCAGKGGCSARLVG